MPATAPITMPAIAPPERLVEGEGVFVCEAASAVPDADEEAVVVVLLWVEVVLDALEVVLEATDVDGLAEASTAAMISVLP
jgi:hypothetical protein